MTVTPAIAVHDLAFAYRRGRVARPALEQLSFEVRPGEIFGLLGPNGAGKTTAVKILTTILRPDSGRAFVAGHDVVRDPLAARRSLAAVLQENAVETMLSVHDNLLLYGYLHGCSGQDLRRRVHHVIDLLDISDQLTQRAHSMSGGNKRRLQVAKALMIDTQVLFLDEATTGMDPIIKRRVMDALREQVRNGRTVLLTTQLLDEAEALCDRMILMDRGSAIASGRLAELRALAHKMFRIQISFADPVLEAAEAVRALAPRGLEERDGEFVLQVTGSEDEWIRNMAALSARWPLSHLEIRGASLEDIFVELYRSHREAQPRSTAP